MYREKERMREEEGKYMNLRNRFWVKEAFHSIPKQPKATTRIHHKHLMQRLQNQILVKK
jgi:hypothetical protein